MALIWVLILDSTALRVNFAAVFNIPTMFA
jgi:hypothetical protein